MLRGTGAVGSACSSGTLEPAVVKDFSVDRASTVAGAATNAVIVVCRVSAALLAASKLSSVAQLPPFVAVVVGRDPRPPGPRVGPAPKYSPSMLRREYPTSPAPTTLRAGGVGGAANH